MCNTRSHPIHGISYTCVSKEKYDKCHSDNGSYFALSTSVETKWAHKYKMFHKSQEVCFFFKFNCFLVFPKFLLPDYKSWKLLLARLIGLHEICVYPWMTAGMIPSQLSNLTSFSFQAFETNALPHISPTLDPHLEILHQFLWLSPIYYYYFLLSVYSALFFFLN